MANDYQEPTAGSEAENEDGYDTEFTLTQEQILSGQNLAELIPEEELDRIGHECRRNIEIDDQSRADWMERNDEAFRLAMQVAEQKSYPFSRASNVVYPMITTAALQFAQRAYPAVVPGNRTVNCVVIGDDDGQYRIQTDQNGQPMIGPNAPPPEMVVPPGAKADRAERVSRHMSWQSLFSIKEWEPGIDQLLHYLPIAGCAFRKVFYRADKKRPGVTFVPADRFVINMGAKSIDEAPRFAEQYELYPHEIKAKQLSGEFVDRPISAFTDEEDGDEEDTQAPRTFYEGYTRLDMDGDGYAEPYIITLHDSGKILRMEPNFSQETMNRDGTIDHEVSYVKYSFIPNPEGGFYDVGFGWLLFPINKTVNTAINQLFDAAHWQNAPSGFLGRGIRLGRSGRVELKPNTLLPVDSTGEELRNNVFIYEHPGPSAVMFQLLGLMIEAGRDISSVQEILQGRTDKNLAPTTAMALVEQGMTTFTSIFKRVHRSLKEEFTFLYRLNSKTIPDHMYAYGDILDDPGAIAREDYNQSDMDIRPITDPKMVSDQIRQAKAQFLESLAEKGLIKQRPATERMLEAFNIDGVKDLLPTEEELKAQQESQDAANQMQMAIATAQLNKVLMETLEIEKRLDMDEIDLRSQIDERRSKILQNRTGAVKNIASAEAEEKGSQLEQYREQARKTEE